MALAFTTVGSYSISGPKSGPQMPPPETKVGYTGIIQSCDTNISSHIRLNKFKISSMVAQIIQVDQVDQ